MPTNAFVFFFTASLDKPCADVLHFSKQKRRSSIVFVSIIFVKFHDDFCWKLDTKLQRSNFSNMLSVDFILSLATYRIFPIFKLFFNTSWAPKRFSDLGSRNLRRPRPHSLLKNRLYFGKIRSFPRCLKKQELHKQKYFAQPCVQNTLKYVNK